MADDDRKEKVHKLIQSKVQPLVDEGCKLTAEASKELRGSIAEIDEAIKSKAELELLTTYQRDLKIDQRRMMAAAFKVREAITALDEVGKDDDDFEAAQDEIKALKKKLAGAVQTAKQDLVDGDARDRQVKDQLAKRADNEDQATKKWVAIATLSDRNEDLLKRSLKKWQDWEAAAGKAVTDRDGAALKKLQASPPANNHQDALSGKLNANNIVTFAKDWHVSHFSQAFRSRVVKDSATLKAADKSNQALAKQCAEVQPRVAKLVIKPRDANKAATLLKLPSGALSKLEPILEMDPGAMATALESLGKSFKVELAGKEAVATLKKGGVL